MLDLPVHPFTGLTAIGLRRDGRPIWPVLGGSEPPANPPAPPAGDPPKTDPPKPEPPKDPKAGDPPKDPAKKPDEPLGEGGLKALQAEREANKQLRDQFEQFKKSLSQAIGVDPAAKDKTELEQLTERLAKHEEELAKARTAAARATIAAKHQISEEDAAEFLTGADEAAMTRQAERLAAIRGQAAAPGTPRPDPTQGSQGGAGLDIDAQILEAQKKGDVREAILLKNQKKFASKK